MTAAPPTRHWRVPLFSLGTGVTPQDHPEHPVCFIPEPAQHVTNDAVTWRGLRDLVNFYRLVVFAEQLPGIRKHVAAQLRRRTLDRDRVLAGMVSIIDLSQRSASAPRNTPRTTTFSG